MKSDQAKLLKEALQLHRKKKPHLRVHFSIASTKK
jgi:hypothetical protein